MNSIITPKKKISFKKKILIGFATLVVIGIFTDGSNDNDNKSDKAADKTLSQQPTEEPAFVYPANETTLIEASKKAMEKAKSAKKDIQKGCVLNERNKTNCSTIGSFNIKYWISTITTIDSNSTGYGILTIKLYKIFMSKIGIMNFLIHFIIL